MERDFLLSRLTIALLAVVILVALGHLASASVSAMDTLGHRIDSGMVKIGDFASTESTRHADDHCDHEHESAECSPCPTCSGGLPPTPIEDSSIVASVRLLAVPSHYDDVVPNGIRRPPRSA